MIVRHPFIEPPFSCEHHRDADGELTEFGRRGRDRLTYYDLSNHYTVSVLRDDGHAYLSPRWEAWVFITGEPIKKTARTRRPVACKDEHNALCYRDAIAKLPNAPMGTVLFDHAREATE